VTSSANELRAFKPDVIASATCVRYLQSTFQRDEQSGWDLGDAFRIIARLDLANYLTTGRRLDLASNRADLPAQTDQGHKPCWTRVYDASYYISTVGLLGEGVFPSLCHYYLHLHMSHPDAVKQHIRIQSMASRVEFM
jgi:hypothetical protein